MTSFTVRFVSKDFVIEDSTVWLYPVVPSTQGPAFDLATPKRNFEASSLFQALTVTQGSANAAGPLPDHIAGVLFDVKTRRSSGDVRLYAFTEFRHAVTEDERRVATILVDMEAYGEVLLEVRDVSGHKVVGGVIGLARVGQEGGIDLPLDERGEANLLLPPGAYFTWGGQFEVQKAQAKQIIEVVLPARIIQLRSRKEVSRIIRSRIPRTRAGARIGFSARHA